MNYSFTFKEIHPFSEACLKGSFIWILHANKIPPHIGISSKSNFFSLKTDGKDLAVNTSSVIKISNAKNIALILVELKEPLLINSLEEVFQEYTKIPDDSSCLEPIEKLLCTTLEESSISNLLKELEKKKKVKKYFGLNLPEDYIGVPSYGKKEIDERILKLKHAKRQKSIS